MLKYGFIGLFHHQGEFFGEQVYGFHFGAHFLHFPKFQTGPVCWVFRCGESFDSEASTKTRHELLRAARPGAQSVIRRGM